MKKNNIEMKQLGGSLPFTPLFQSLTDFAKLNLDKKSEALELFIASLKCSDNIKKGLTMAVSHAMALGGKQSIFSIGYKKKANNILTAIAAIVLDMQKGRSSELAKIEKLTMWEILIYKPTSGPQLSLNEAIKEGRILAFSEEGCAKVEEIYNLGLKK